MSNDLSKEQISKLFLIRSEHDIEAFLQLLIGTASDEWSWHPCR